MSISKGIAGIFGLNREQKNSEDEVAKNAIASSCSEDEEIRAQAAIELGRIGGTKAVEQLEILLKDPVGRVRALAIDALRKVGSDSCVSKLVDLLADQENYVVVAAARALGRLGNESVLESLQELEVHEDPEIANACSKAAARLRGDEKIEKETKRTAKLEREAEEKRRYQELRAAMKSTETISKLLDNLNYSSSTSQWLTEKVVVNIYLDFEDAYGRVYKNECKPIGEVGERGDLQTSVSRIFDAWTNSDLIFHNDRGHEIESGTVRDVYIDRKQLTLYIGCKAENLWGIVTARRLGPNEFLVLKSYETVHTRNIKPRLRLSRDDYITKH